MCRDNFLTFLISVSFVFYILSFIQIKRNIYRKIEGRKEGVGFGM